MLRINSTTTRAVTAFDVVGLFCIFGMPPYGLMPQLRRAHYNTLHVYCLDNAIFFLQKTNKKNSRASFHRRGYLSKNAREPPLVPSFYPLPSLCQAFSSTLSHHSTRVPKIWDTRIYDWGTRLLKYELRSTNYEV